MQLKETNEMANGVDPDQTAPIGAVKSGSALFAQAYFSQYLELVWLFKESCASHHFFSSQL